MWELRKLAIHDPQWLSLIEQTPTATVFHHPAWMGLLSTCYGYTSFILALVREGQVCAGLPMAEVNNLLTARRYVALPFSDYCKPLYRDDESLCLLLNTLVEQQQAKRFPRIEIRCALPDQDHIQEVTPFVLHTLALETDTTQVAKRANRQQMQNVRTAEKNGIRVVRSTDLDQVRVFYRLHSLNRRRQGVPVQPWGFFNCLTRFILKQGLGFLIMAYKEDLCISVGLFLTWQGTLTYKYSAIDEAYQSLRPNHLVTWTAIKWGCENGFTTFDFGRADLQDEGLRSYKRRWGADEAPLSYSYIPSVPGRIPGGNGRVRALLKEVICHSPVCVCRAIGEIAYRYAG